MSDRRRSGGPPSRRRTPPPESTGREAGYLRETVAAGQVVHITLLDGSRISGRLAEAEADTLRVESESGSTLVRKTQIRYVEGP